MKQRLVVSLIERAHDYLERVATVRKLTKEQAFERGLRNGIKAYSGLEMGGTVQLVSPQGKIVRMQATPIKPVRRRPWWQIWRRQPEIVELPSTHFEAMVDEKTLKVIRDLAKVWSLGKNDMVNRIIQVGCEIDIYFAQGYRAWLRDSGGAPVGELVFD